MMNENNKQAEQDLIIEIKKEIQAKINEVGYQEYRLSKQEELRQFVEELGWDAIDGDKLLEEAGDKDEK